MNRYGKSNNIFGNYVWLKINLSFKIWYFYDEDKLIFVESLLLECMNAIVLEQLTDIFDIYIWIFVKSDYLADGNFHLTLTMHNYCLTSFLFKKLLIFEYIFFIMTLDINNLFIG